MDCQTAVRWHNRRQRVSGRIRSLPRYRLPVPVGHCRKFMLLEIADKIFFSKIYRKNNLLVGTIL